MKYLIIGGGGFVGSWLTHELLSRQHSVVIIDPFIYYSDLDKPRLRKINTFKKKYLLKGANIYHKKFEDGGEKILKKEKPDILIHLAGIPLERTDDNKISLKQLTDDIALTYRIIETVKKIQLKKFIFMSSISAYGDCGDTIDEDYRLLPKTPYGISKASGEFLIKAQLDNWNIIRTTNIYGFADLNERACNIIVDKILKGKNFWINKNIMMDFIYVKDLVAGIAEVSLKAPLKEAFHISGNNAINLIEFVNILKKHFTFEYEIKDIHDRPRRGTMDNKKARKIIGWSPKMNIDKGLADYTKYVKEYGIA
ncbi:MAG: NAD(P)-dependent oxidoreductase [Candidatus Levybacteria bacterium]|nr:NAD(P)-dependent oxidoreductase [Candidatus Levybacteria bacterium]